VNVKKFGNLFALGGLFLLTACLTPNASESGSDSTTPRVFQTDQVETSAPVPTQTILFQPTPENPAENETGTLRSGGQVLIFLEVTQTTILGENSVQSPVVGVDPVIFFYDPDSKVLLLHPTITVASTTGLLIGVMTVLQTPDQVYEKREIVQFPSVQPGLIQIAAFDAKAGTVNLVYADETYNLSPGESRTFKQIGGGSNTLTVITLIVNHGHLTDIQPVSPDGSWR
jgi:hypothetical protein